MMNRRQFVTATAASAAMFARIPNAFAQTYELIIKGGRVIDPSVGLDAIRDVAIAGGKIVAVEPNITASAPDTIDARGKIVAPGLIDIHTHAGRSKEGPPLALQDGVTGWVDAGSAGADNIDQIAAVARGAPQIGRLLVNIARTGVAPGGELHDISRANVDLARGAIARHRDVVVGVKARLSNNVADTNDLEALRRAQAAAGEPAGDDPRRPELLAAALAPFAAQARRHRHPHVRAGAERHPRRQGHPDPGRDGGAPPRHHLRLRQRRRRSLRLADGGKGDQARLLPDTFSTDWSTASKTTGVVDFPNVMSKFLMFGMSLSQIIACATVNAARVFPSFDDRGTLNVGAPADVAILELRDGTFEFVDNYKGTRTGKQCLFPIATVLNGKRAPARA